MADPFAKYTTPQADGAGPEMVADPADPFAKYAAPEDAKPSVLGSVGSGIREGLSFGLSGDRAYREKSKKANPWTHFAGEMIGSAVPMVAASMLPTGVTQTAAAGRGAQLLNRGYQLARGALVPGEAATMTKAAIEGAKIGGVYSALSGAGHTEAAPDDSVADVAKKALGNAVTAGTVGMAVGAPLGVAGYGLSKLVGAGLNRTMPELKEVMEAASAPQLQGIKDVMQKAGYDKYTLADFAALRDALRDPSQAHRYAGLNLIEALEAKPLVPMAGTGELKPPVTVSPNLRDQAQDWAHVNGQGRQSAIEKFANRKNEMPAAIQGDVDEFFNVPGVAGLQRQFGDPGALPHAERLPGVIDQHFGSGSKAIDEAALLARKEAFDQRYNRIRSKPLQNIDGQLGANLQSIPSFQSALRYAAENDAIRLSEADMAAKWGGSWASGKLGENIGTLSPSNILDIHHALVLNSKPPITGPTPESMMAGKLKSAFSDWVDGQFRGHKALREDYYLFKRTMEAKELAAKLPVNSGGADHPALKFLGQAVQDVDEGAQSLAKKVAAYDAEMVKYQNGLRKTPPDKRLSDMKADLARQEARQEIVDTFRRTWGDAQKQEIAQSGNGDAYLQKALTPEGQRRIMMALGDKGKPFLNDLLTMEARNKGLSLGLNAGGADHAALQFFDRAVRNGQTDVVNAFRKAWGDRIKQEIAQSTAGTNSVVNKLLTQEGKDRILRILGPEDGKMFIESLYNKQMQNGFSQTLFGGPDTAYKLARNSKADSLMDAVHGIVHLRPMQTLKALGEIGSSAYKQRRADQGNALLSQQGPEDVGKIVDAILSRYRLGSTGDPYVLNPALNALGPLSQTLVGQQMPSISEAPKAPAMKPYRP